MSELFESLMNGLDEVERFLGGERKSFRVHVPDQVNVREIRTRLGMTQARFSDAFGFSLDAVKHWEGGRRIPESSARAYLTVIARNPAAVISALRPPKPANRARKKASASETAPRLRARRSAVSR